MSAVYRRYAQALYELAQERDKLAEVRAELGEIANAVREVPELRAIVHNPELSAQARVALFDDLLGGAEELVRNFVRLLAEKERLRGIEQIVGELERIVAESERRLRVELTTAQPLSDDEADLIVSQIEQAAGQSVEASRRVDPTIVGGLILQAGSHRLDASIRSRLERLRRGLVTA